jgi:site-specific recombinase XerD
MNVTNLQENYPKLIAYMEDNSYAKAYIDRFEREIKRILQLADSRKWQCYADIYLEYEHKGCSVHALRNKKGMLAAIEQFDVYGKYPGCGSKNNLIPRSAYHSLCPEYKGIIDLYRRIAQKDGKRESTIRTEASNASGFLLDLQMLGIESLDDVTEESVLGAFIAPDGSVVRGCSFKKNISAIFKACMPHRPEGCSKVLALLPAFRETRKNIQYLKEDEVAMIKEALGGNDGLLSLRDKAIGTLALHTGLRGCDIAGLTLDSLDWENDLICIRQQKTEEPLELPLSTVVGNALYDYLVSERPAVNHDYVFVSQSRPHGRMHDGSLGNVAARIMRAAAVRQEPGDRKGLHIFRHRLATALLGNGIPRPVISGVLGHISPDSLEAYLSADFPHLKECAISIERFPVSEEVFGHE